MLKRYDSSNYSFWLLILVTFGSGGLGLVVISWNYRQGWAQTIWHICQSGIENLGQHMSLAWQLIILTIVSIVMIRGGWSMLQQVWRTRRFIHLFSPFCEAPPARLLTLLEVHKLTAENVIYLNLPTTHVFCLGFWRPRIWLTAGLVNLLTDEELAAVLAHEVYHCCQRDPLRLLISRTLKSAFFFLPLVGDLVKFAELQQEVAADQSAIVYLGNDLPLLCALQKLLTQGTKGILLPGAAFTPFNVTEARLRRLIYPSQTTSFNWRIVMANMTLNLGIIMILTGVGFLSIQPVIVHGESGACAIEEVTNSLQTQIPSSYW